MNTNEHSRSLIKLQLGIFWHSGTGSLARAILCNTVPHDESILMRREFGHHGIQFGRVPKNKVDTLLLKDRGLYEILLEDTPRKVYFDIDNDTDTLVECKERILETFKDAEMCISGSVGMYKNVIKYSYHIILKNYYYLNHNDALILKSFCEYYKILGFDPNVYSKNQCIKCINQAKVAPKQERRIQAYISGSTYRLDHVIQMNIHTTAINAMSISFPISCVARIQPTSISISSVDIKCASEFTKNITEDFDWHNASNLEKLNLIPNGSRNSGFVIPFSANKIICKWCKQYGLTFTEFWLWCKQKDSSNSRRAKYQEIYNNTNFESKYATIDKIICAFYPNITKRKATKLLERNMDITPTKVIQGKFLTRDALPNINETTQQKKVYFLVSGMGSAKSYITENFLVEYKQKFPNSRLLWITPRITLSQNTKGHLIEKGIDFVSYIDYNFEKKKDGTFERNKNILCSIQSLHYLNQDYDVIVIDEIETVLNTFSKNAETHSGLNFDNIEQNWNTFTSIISNARYVICMDAMVSKCSINFTRSLCNEEPSIINTTERPTKTILNVMKVYSQSKKDYKYDYTATLSKFLMTIIDYLRDGKKIYIYTPFKIGEKRCNGVEAITALLIKEFNWNQGEQIISYNSERKENKKCLINCKNVWSNPTLRCVITNSCISVGVDFSEKDVFDKVFAIYNPIISSRGFFQSLRRIRYPVSNEIILVRDNNQFVNGYIKKDLRITDPVFIQLRKDLLIEENANNNVKDFETLNFFTRYCGFEMCINDTEKLTKENKLYMAKILKDTDIVFDYDKITSVSHDTYLIILSNIEYGIETFDERLQLLKYYHDSNFIKTDKSHIKSSIKTLWCHNSIINGLNKLLTYPDCIINKLFDYNNYNMGLDVPEKLLFPNNITLTDIQNEFKFTYQPKSRDTMLIIKMVNSFFGYNIFNYDKGIDGTEYLCAINDVYKYLIKHPKNQEINPETYLFIE